MNKEAMYYQVKGDEIKCLLCPHMCRLKKGSIGICGIRKNMDMKLESMSYAQVTSIAVDPIEKKPLRRFLPGTNILSVGSYGCNLRCPWCQNFNISQSKPSYTKQVTPKEIIKVAIENKQKSIAYTYNEPLINYEYVYETARLAKSYNLNNVLVTAAYINEEPLKELLPYIDAMNIDLKCFNNERFRKYCHGDLNYIKNAIMLAADNTHVEITTLIVPKFNDDLNELDKMFSWISRKSTRIPLHIARYFPRYQFRESATDLMLMQEIKKIAENYLENVYLGNV
jgi:pyruvate formate lyase activating enzyme